jgi:hypothetical protein
MMLIVLDVPIIRAQLGRTLDAQHRFRLMHKVLFLVVETVVLVAQPVVLLAVVEMVVEMVVEIQVILNLLEGLLTVGEVVWANQPVVLFLILLMMVEKTLEMQVELVVGKLVWAILQVENSQLLLNLSLAVV